MIELGKKVAGKTVMIPPSILKTMESVVDGLYQLDIKTTDIVDEKKTAEALINGLREKFGIKVHYISVDKSRSMIKVQMSGSPFLFSALLLSLPAILSLVGVAILVVVVSLIVVEKPILAVLGLIGLALFGGGLLWMKAK